MEIVEGDLPELDLILNTIPNESEREVVKTVLVSMAADQQRLTNKVRWFEQQENLRRRERLERFACAAIRSIMNEDIIDGDARIDLLSKRHASLAFDYAEAMLAECDRRTVPQ